MCKTGAAIDNNGSNTHFEFNIGGVLEKVKKKWLDFIWLPQFRNKTRSKKVMYTRYFGSKTS